MIMCLAYYAHLSGSLPFLLIAHIATPQVAIPIPIPISSPLPSPGLLLQCACHGSGMHDWRWAPALYNIIVLLLCSIRHSSQMVNMSHHTLPGNGGHVHQSCQHELGRCQPNLDGPGKLHLSVLLSSSVVCTQDHVVFEHGHVK